MYGMLCKNFSGRLLKLLGRHTRNELLYFFYLVMQLWEEVFSCLYFLKTPQPTVCSQLNLHLREHKDDW